MINTRLLGAALLPLSVIFSCPAEAQTVPDAGSLLQHIERERQPALPPLSGTERPVEPPAMSAQAAISTTVNAFRFVGNSLLSTGQLDQVVLPYRNRPLDYRQLQAAVAEVANAYRNAGWIVRAYLPPQDISEGMVTIQIIEAVFGGIHQEGPDPSRLNPSDVREIFAAHQKNGDFLNAAALDRALLLADDLPGVVVAGSLQAGAKAGETDLIVKLGDEALVTGDVAVDNTGAKSTGDQRIAANVNLNSPAGIGDLLSLNAIHSRGSDYGRLAYSVPVGSDGWRLGMSGSDFHYALVQAPQNPDTDNGSSTSVGLDASYPLIRSRQKNLYLNLNADHKTFDNRLAASPGGVASRYAIDEYSVALNGNLFDNVGGGGANSLSIAVVGGVRDNDIGTTNQSFTKLRYSLTRQQAITGDLSLYGALSGQEAGKNLDSSERFYLGGSGGVRAYPTSEAGGSSAYLANLELRWKLPQGFTLTGFVDSGAVRNYDNAGKNYSLSGAGLAVGWQSTAGPILQATWASRIGNNPYPADKSESVKQDRFWLTAVIPFSMM